MYRLRLKEILASRKPKISQGKLSRGADVPPNLISRMVNDPMYQPSYVTLKKVADYLGITVDELIEEVDDNEEDPSS